jgi:predicted metal-dependent hydrolase
MQPGTVSFGSERIRYTIIERPRRRTLGIEVYPNGSVIVLRPPNCADVLLEEKLKKRAKWISHQLAHFRQYDGTVPFQQYLSGESCRYLGRQYRLKVVEARNGSKPAVRLARNELLVSVRSQPMPNPVRRLLENWYLQRARDHFNSVLDESFRPFQKRGFERPCVFIRQMKRRWGSLSASGQMTLNARLIQTPKACIEYVIVHELCHLVHQDHSANFWQLLDKIMPDWQKRKHKLELALLY